MEDASEGDLLLEGQCEQPSASWLALNIPAGQAGTQRDHLRISGIVAARRLSLELKSKRFWPPLPRSLLPYPPPHTHTQKDMEIPMHKMSSSDLENAYLTLPILQTSLVKNTFLVPMASLT